MWILQQKIFQSIYFLDTFYAISMILKFKAFLFSKVGDERKTKIMLNSMRQDLVNKVTLGSICENA